MVLVSPVVVRKVFKCCIEEVARGWPNEWSPLGEMSQAYPMTENIGLLRVTFHQTHDEALRKYFTKSFRFILILKKPKVSVEG